jgi:hypothetical protein
MDKALPGKHTLYLYRSLTLDQIAILIQARTGYYRLNQYLSRIGLVDKAKCSCRDNEEQRCSQPNKATERSPLTLFAKKYSSIALFDYLDNPLITLFALPRNLGRQDRGIAPQKVLFLAVEVPRE